jgi:hypothetical protein
MFKRLSLLALLLAGALISASGALAAGGNYTVTGGTASERAQVHSALDASAFPWSIVPGPIAITIAHGGPSQASPGAISLDANLLDAGRFSWGVVQHEYAHQVDFALLDDGMRNRLAPLLGGAYWWPPYAFEGHAAADCERFADMVAWAYWPSGDNVMRASTPSDENYGISPEAFRAALQSALPALAAALPLRTTAAATPKPKRSHH